MSRGLVIVLCAGLGGACLREPTFNGPRDADNGGEQVPVTCESGIVVMANGEGDRGARVCGPGYEMVFSDTGAKMPYQLNVGGSMLMGSAQNCNDERGIGIGVYPAALVNGEPHAGVDGTLTRPLTGPVIGRVKVDWSVSYTCTGSGILQNYSIFTFFPDGHITRVDRMSQSDLVMSGGCTPCAGGTNGSTMYLTSFATLMAPTSASITGAQIEDLVTYDETVSGVRNPCLSTSGQHVAFGFRNTNTRIRVTNTLPRTIAFVQNVIVGGQIAAFADDVTTHMMVSSETACADLAPVMLAWSERPELNVQGVNMGPALDGIYGGENDSGSTAIQTTVGDIPIQLAGSTPVPAGAAVWISFGAQPTASPVVTHNGVPSAPSGEWYRIQRVSGSQLIFWFRDPIVAGTVITIHPN